MVDPVGSKPVSSLDRRIAPVTAGTPAARLDAVADRADPPRAVSVADAARTAAQSAPVDHDRVATLRAAIANGSYRPAPQAIADKLLGAKQEWIAK